jgi:hypothetical protein
MKNTNEKIKIGIDIINRKAKALKKDDWSQLSDQLRDLRKYLHDLEYWLDGELRAQAEAGARQKAQAIIDAGFTFDSIVINKVPMKADGTTKTVRDDDDIPF